MTFLSKPFRIFIAAVFIGATLVSFLPNAPGADVSSEFDAANRLFEQGRFTEAAVVYRQLIDSGTKSAALYFNLANASVKAGEVGRAIAAYRTAEQLAPRDPDIRANLAFARKQVQGPTLAPARSTQLLRRLTLNEWTIVTGVAVWTWLGILIARQIRRGRGLSSATWISSLMAFVCTCLLAAAYTTSSRPMAIVVVDRSIARNGPLDESPAAFELHDGAEVRVLDEKNDWIQISLGDRRVGWIKRDEAVR